MNTDAAHRLFLVAIVVLGLAGRDRVAVRQWPQDVTIPSQQGEVSGMSQFVLELGAGEVKKNGLKLGDRLDY